MCLNISKVAGKDLNVKFWFESKYLMKSYHDILFFFIIRTQCFWKHLFCICMHLETEMKLFKTFFVCDISSFSHWDIMTYMKRYLWISLYLTFIYLTIIFNLSVITRMVFSGFALGISAVLSVFHNVRLYLTAKVHWFKMCCHCH